MTDHTDSYGPHRRVVRRPPRQDRLDGEDAEAAIRLECLDCGFDSQGHPQCVEFLFMNSVPCDETRHPGGRADSAAGGGGR